MESENDCWMAMASQWQQIHSNKGQAFWEDKHLGVGVFQEQQTHTHISDDVAFPAWNGSARKRCCCYSLLAFVLPSNHFAFVLVGLSFWVPSQMSSQQIGNLSIFVLIWRWAQYSLPSAKAREVPLSKWRTKATQKAINYSGGPLLFVDPLGLNVWTMAVNVNAQQLMQLKWHEYWDAKGSFNFTWYWPYLQIVAQGSGCMPSMLKIALSEHDWPLEKHTRFFP